MTNQHIRFPPLQYCMLRRLLSFFNLLFKFFSLVSTVLHHSFYKLSFCSLYNKNSGMMNLTSQSHHPSDSPRSTIQLYVLSFLIFSIFLPAGQYKQQLIFKPSSVSCLPPLSAKFLVNTRFLLIFSGEKYELPGHQKSRSTGLFLILHKLIMIHT